VNHVGVLCLVLLAAYGLTSLALSVVVGCLWRGLAAMPLTSRSLFALRMLPSIGASFLTLSVVLPAFLIKEPNRAAEPVGPLLILMAGGALLTVGAGCWRVWRAWLATSKLLSYGRSDRSFSMAGRDVEIFDLPEVLVAVVGVWQPRIVAATRVLEACSREELLQVIGHEAAHIAAKDNLKLLLLLASPDLLAWMPAGEGLVMRWRAAAECEADATAAGQDPLHRLALAAALIKVARLSGARRERAALCMHIVADDLDRRVRRLLAPLPAAHAFPPAGNTASLALLIPFLGLPLYGSIQDVIEMLVAFGR
jgi:Zn-dependent protease with chaperone function